MKPTSECCECWESDDPEFKLSLDDAGETLAAVKNIFLTE